MPAARFASSWGLWGLLVGALGVYALGEWAAGDTFVGFSSAAETNLKTIKPGSYPSAKAVSDQPTWLLSPLRFRTKAIDCHNNMVDVNYLDRSATTIVAGESAQ